MKPKIGQWYKSQESGEQFEVVAIDDEDELIELQYFDGTIEEIDFYDWDLIASTTGFEAISQPPPYNLEDIL